MQKEEKKTEFIGSRFESSPVLNLRRRRPYDPSLNVQSECTYKNTAQSEVIKPIKRWNGQRIFPGCRQKAEAKVDAE